jgi:hypothetical protein
MMGDVRLHSDTGATMAMSGWGMITVIIASDVFVARLSTPANKD